MNTTKEFDGMKMTKINGNAGGRMNSDLKMLSQRQTLETQEEERQDTREGSDNSNNKQVNNSELLRHQEISE